MIPLITRAEALRAEARYAESAPLRGLMARAGEALCERACVLSPHLPAAILCGAGNNGGDGYALALSLLRRGRRADCFSFASPKGDSAFFAEEFLRAGGRILPYTEQTDLAGYGLLVDALFGTGLSRAPEGLFAHAIGQMNALPLPVLSADVPSGVRCDGGVFSPAVRATETVTFLRAKPCAYLSESYALCGRVFTDSLGVPEECFDAPTRFATDGESARASLPPRLPDSHKGNYPRVLLAVGAEGYSGAAILAARAALRTGAGLVFCGVPRAIYPIVAAQVPEAVVFPLPDQDGALTPDALPLLLSHAEGCGAILCGCGLGRAPGAQELARALTAQAPCPVVLDADGINAFSGHIDALRKAPFSPVLTPHLGELARLLGEAPLRSGESAPEAACRIASDLGVTLVMKGHRNVTASPDGRAFVNTTGNAGMARGGSGDVLAGMVTSLYAGAPRPESAAAAVWFHGRAGDLAAERRGMTAMLPGDLINCFTEAFHPM